MLKSLEGAQDPVRHLPEGLSLPGDGMKDPRNIERTTLLTAETTRGLVVSVMIARRALRPGSNVLEVETGEIALLMRHTAKERLLESKIMALAGSLRIIGSAIISKGAGIPPVPIIKGDLETMLEVVGQTFLKSESHSFNC
jgi:hypothetical protein